MSKHPKVVMGCPQCTFQVEGITSEKVLREEYEVPYFAVYNVHLFVQIFEGKMRMRIICG